MTTFTASVRIALNLYRINHRMNKRAISLTLGPENVLWLQGQARATGCRSVSDFLDRLLSDVRTNGTTAGGAVRSVVGSVRISKSDPDLLKADATVRALFPASLARRPRRGRRAGATRRRHGHAPAHLSCRRQPPPGIEGIGTLQGVREARSADLCPCRRDLGSGTARTKRPHRSWNLAAGLLRRSLQQYCVSAPGPDAPAGVSG